MLLRRMALLAVLLPVMCGNVSAQVVGDEAPNKAFLASWNLPFATNEVADYRLPAGLGSVLLLDWFGVS